MANFNGVILALVLTVTSALNLESIEALSSSLRSATGNASTKRMPLWYLHIPKTGTSFQTTLVHTMCKIPKNFSVHSLDGDRHGACRYIEKHKSTCLEGAFSHFACGHMPMPLDVPAEQGVTMIREPLQRIASGYYATPERLHDCKSLQAKHHCENGHCDGDKVMESSFVSNSAISPIAYGKCVQKCYANMLAGANCGDRGPTSVHFAIDRIKRFAFVGLTDHWMLSICLWHKKMGGQPLPVELQNNRPGSAGGNHSTHKYDTQALFGKWKPPIDTRIWKAGADKFWSDIKAYQITEESCQKEFRRNDWHTDHADEHNL